MGRKKHDIKPNRVSELLDGRPQKWLVDELAKTKKPITTERLQLIVCDKVNINSTEAKSIIKVFERTNKAAKKVDTIELY